jgi:hypothetical protein
LKPSTRMTLVLAGALLFGCSAFAASLDRSHAWVPSGTQLQTRMNDGRGLINDGSFELGPPPASAWTETNNTTCERIGDWSGQWYMSSWDGYQDYWAGGYCYDTGPGVPITSSVTQSVTVPSDSSVVSFYYVTFRIDPDDVPPDGDRVYMAINGTELWSVEMTSANNTYPNWTGPIQVDLSAYTGQTVSLGFGGVSVGDVTGNARIDYINFLYNPTPTRATSWGAVKSLYR